MADETKTPETPAAEPTTGSVIADLVADVQDMIADAGEAVATGEKQVADLTAAAQKAAEIDRAAAGVAVHDALTFVQHAKDALARLHKAEAGLTQAAQGLAEHAIFVAKGAAK